MNRAIRAMAALLATCSAASAAPATPYGVYAPERPCFSDGLNTRVSRGNLTIYETLVCDMGNVRPTKGGWIADLSNCIENPDGYDFVPVAYRRLTITPLADGQHMFGLDIGPDPVFTLYKCENL